MMMQAVCGILKITKSDLHFWGQLNLIKQLQLEGKDSMVTILIVYHSQSGNTRKMAEAVARGAREIEGVKAILRRASETGDEDLLNCQGLVLCDFHQRRKRRAGGLDEYREDLPWLSIQENPSANRS